MKSKILFGLLFILLVSCGQTDKNKLSSTEAINHEKIFYIETNNFGLDLKSCYNNSIINKWSDLNFKLNDNSKPFSGNEISNKHTFFDITTFNEANTPKEFEKIVITLKGDLTVKNTTFSIERFKFEKNGKWRRTANLGDFKIHDRPNDFISPEELDVDELCEQFVQMTVKASYK